VRALQTKEAAIDELEAYKEQIEQGVVSFADLAAKVSDCSSAKVRHCFSIVASSVARLFLLWSFFCVVVVVFVLVTDKKVFLLLYLARGRSR